MRVAAAQTDEIRRVLESSPDVAAVFYESPEEAYLAFSRRYPAQKNDIGPEHLPASFRVKLADPARFSDDVAGLAGRPGVFMVRPVDP
ncbi:permease-like cell division protein FtsX [Yinghuangia soli]|uniref:Permease-like cell division protein FtsX n=1 Tax=Yinghuangia soli TaxID=2908204 RepID=A0AA41PX59_9ACTN|nr:permease-like cell division protein FtsX [Yinghuangia soli]MCF2527528.1 permease-like cell division protein FtsX [Yinghuangia soli]